MENRLDLTPYQGKKIHPARGKFGGNNLAGQQLGLTNYYMERDGKPFFGLSGEFHFSRCSEQYWEDELIKMKLCGINIIATYVIWIHHEEREGLFRFDGRRDLRRFIELCQKHELYVIVRIGPFAHGEVRNGGLPDWLYGKPYEVRSLDEGFISVANRWYAKVGEQMKGLYYKDGGPIIGAQLDNEYMHSAAPWEITTGISNEWTPAGNDGVDYLLKLKQLAIYNGIEVPFYTCTGWGSPTPFEEMLPLWGGYAFRPWLFYTRTGEHPPTEEYIYRDYHNNEHLDHYNFTPQYLPEQLPYACCEMGGGMMCSYNYRFELPYASVEAMANIKIASGCNFLGYYVFRGGTNPKGELTPFLNEGQVAKLSYDYQAAIGEYGQIRESYKRLKSLHLFVNGWSDQLCQMQTALPAEAQSIEPTDVDTIRYAVRVKQDSGFLFINNYQDHIATQDKEDFEITLALTTEEIHFRNMSLKRDESCILPFNMDLSGYVLKQATVQPMTQITYQGVPHYFFFIPEGMEPQLMLDAEGIESIAGINYESTESVIKLQPKAQEMTHFIIKGTRGRVEVILLTRKQSLQFYQCSINGQETVILTEGTLLYEEKALRVQSTEPQVIVYSFPEIGKVEHESVGLWCKYHLSTEPQLIKSTLQQVGPTRYTAAIEENWKKGAIKEALLKVDYIGDIGQAFIDGEMIADQFCNGAVWEIGLSEFETQLKGKELTFYIAPLKEGSKVNVESAMAARIEEIQGTVGQIHRIEVEPIYEMKLAF